MATAPAKPEKMTLDRTDGSATIALYRAALGPVHTDYYLKAFTRFDASGKTGPLWNWTAALLTLNWLLFRQLWIAALGYAGALVAAALLLVGIARLVFQVSVEVQWLLAGIALLLAIGLPGAFGNVWLYAACNQKMERALVASATLEEACALLAARAAGRKHMAGLLAGNLALGALLATLVLSWPERHSPPFDPGQATRAVPVESLHSGLATQSVGTASEPRALASAPAPEATAPAASTPPAPPAPAAASRISQGVVQIAVAPVVQPAQTSANAEPASAAAPVAQAPAPASSAPTPAAPTPAAHKAVKAAKAPPAVAAAARPERAASATASATANEKFLINVGLFADANNARNALAKLQDAGLPAQSQQIKSAKGQRIRVRSGPFETQAEAERAVEKIRALKLDAVVFKP